MSEKIELIIRIEIVDFFNAFSAEVSQPDVRVFRRSKRPRNFYKEKWLRLYYKKFFTFYSIRS